MNHLRTFLQRSAIVLVIPLTLLSCSDEDKGKKSTDKNQKEESVLPDINTYDYGSVEPIDWRDPHEILDGHRWAQFMMIALQPAGTRLRGCKSNSPFNLKPII